MARCDSCNKFVSYGEEPDIELEGEDSPELELSGDTLTATWNLTITIGLTCAECGQILKTATEEVEVSESYTFAKGQAITLKDITDELVVIWNGAGWQIENIPDVSQLFEVGNEEPEFETRYEGKGRFTKTFYGVKVPLHIGDGSGEAIIETEARVEVQASHFEDP